MMHLRNGRFCFLIIAMLAWAGGAFAAEPHWIWSSTNQDAGKQTLFFRKVLIVRKDFRQATLTVDADDGCDFYINGKKVASVADWHKPATVNVTKNVVQGENILAARVTNAVAAAGLIAKLDLNIPTHGDGPYNPKQHAGLRWIESMGTGKDWVYSPYEASGWNKLDFDDGDWKPAVSEGKIGVEPWGNVFATHQATAASAITVKPGFKVELLHSADATEGSWISMTADDKGRLIISPQSEGKLLRVTLAHGKVDSIERLSPAVTSAMGLLYAEHSLFANAHGPQGIGVYRMMEKGDDFGPPVLLHIMDGDGEHGSHGLVLGPDHRLYVVSGNFTKIPKDLLPTSPLKNYADDQLLPRAPDGKGFGNGLIPPGGFVLRMDLDGSHPELFAAGTRNTYDIAFNPDGELFGFDSDMEWDWGAPWYRPIRINHWVSGGDYGFREGSGKFPEYYEDTLPANLDVGIGSPTGIMFGTDSHFPARYRSALFLLDWAYGRIFAAHLTPHGATYDASIETILRGIPLNLTALSFGKDGALYFITGGRGTESGLYRLTYVGKRIKEHRKTDAELQAEADGVAGRRLRHDLEFFHGQKDPRIIDVVWPALGSDDRWIRFAARTALEFQDVAAWQNRALTETRSMAALTALLALARSGPTNCQNDLILALHKFPLATLDVEEQLLKLRVLEVCFSRQGRPDSDTAQLVIDELDPLYPAYSQPVNQELCQLLLYLDAPDAVSKTMALLDKAPTQEEQVEYVLRLRTITNHWTIDERKDYFSWFRKNRDNAEHPPELLQYFKDAGRDYSDGASLSTFLTNFLQDAVATLTPTELTNLGAMLPPPTNAPVVEVKKHTTIKDWKMADIEPDLDKVKTKRSFTRGRDLFTEAQCIQCHRFGKSGGSVGPELAAVSSRLTARDILESILLPSKVLSEQYQNTIVSTKDGDDVTGRIVEETDQKLIVMTDQIKGTKVEILKTDVAGRRASKVSPMPEGLVNFMTKNEILDLIAYLESGGKKNYAAYK